MGTGLQPSSLLKVVLLFRVKSNPELWGGKQESYSRSASEMGSGLQPRTLLGVVLPTRAKLLPEPNLFDQELFMLSPRARKEHNKLAESLPS